MHEANAVSTAYHRLGMLDDQSKIDLRAKLKTYLAERLELYRLPIGFSIIEDASIYDATQLAKIAEVQAEVWDGAVAACSRAPTTSPCNLILPALNDAYEAARDRSGANQRHPPRIIYVMLFGLGLGGSLLAGFGMGAAERRSVDPYGDVRSGNVSSPLHHYRHRVSPTGSNHRGLLRPLP